MNQEELDCLERMENTEGWRIYLRLLKEVFDKKYRSLRKFKKSESLYERTNGFLDGIETAQSILTDTVQEFKSVTPDKG